MTQRQVVAVFGSSQTSRSSDEWREAENVGARLASAGIAVLTGGYGGTMEAASKGAAEAGGHVIGVTVPAIFPGRIGANPHVIEEIEATSLTDRLGRMFSMSDGTIAMPGSIGTATELIVSWNLNYVVRNNGGRRIPSVAVGGAWKAVGGSLVEQTGADEIDVHFEPTGARAVDWMLAELEIPGV